ncbi:MAG: AAA family ATPase, partial [Thermoleophilaceae bacterium]
ATQVPLVVLTSNNVRELSEGLKRRCLYLYIDYPTIEREKAIVLRRVPEIGETLADQVAKLVSGIRRLELKKAPSIAETLDWARTLLALSITSLDDETVGRTLPVLLKFNTDISKALEHLGIKQ